MMKLSATRRGLLGLMSASVVTACAPLGKASPFWGTIAAGVSGQPATKVSREYADKLPYASILAWFDGSPQALLVLGEVNSERQYVWYSAERQAIATHGLVAVRLLGTDIELRSTRLGPGWDANPLANVGRRLVRTLDIFVEGERVQLTTESRFEARDIERVEILGREHRLRRVVERVSAEGRRRHTNEYWVEDETGKCWKSRQIAAPTLPELNLEIVKYPTV